MNENSIALLKSLTQADGIPGYEAEVRDLFRDAVSDVGTIELTDWGVSFVRALETLNNRVFCSIRT